MTIPQLTPSQRGEPIGPLADMVFLLLMFFLLAGILEPAPPVSVDPPVAEHAETEDGRRLRVLLDAGGQIAFEGEVLDATGLAEAVAMRIATEGPRVAVVEADGQASVDGVLKLVAALRGLGLEDIRLATRPLRIGPDDDG